MCHSSKGCPSDIPSFLVVPIGAFAVICREASLFSFLTGDWSSFTIFVSFIMDLFANFAVEAVLAAEFVRGVSGPFARFVAAARVVSTTDSFPSTEMVIYLFLKDC